MDLLKFAIIFFTCTLASIKAFQCTPKVLYAVDCNRCWCVSHRIPVCTKMICNSIPRKFWSAVKLQSNITGSSFYNVVKTMLKKRNKKNASSRKRTDMIMQRFFKNLNEVKKISSTKKKARSDLALRKFFQNLEELKNLQNTKRKGRTGAVVKGFLDNLRKAAKSRHKARGATFEAIAKWRKSEQSSKGWGNARETMKDLTGIDNGSSEIVNRVFEDLSVLNSTIDY